MVYKDQVYQPGKPTPNAYIERFNRSFVLDDTENQKTTTSSMANVLKGGIVFKKTEIACSKPRYSGRREPLKKRFGQVWLNK